MLWLAGRFGIERMRKAKVILPTDEFFPDSYNADEPSVRQCLDRVCGYMGVPPSTISLEVRDDDDLPGAAGLYQMQEQSKIYLARRQLQDPLRLIATLTHELAHELLLKGGHLTSDVSDHENVTDLLPVFLGVGVFLANATVVSSSVTDGNTNFFSISKQGYLSSITLGYALALFAHIREEPKPQWATHLRTDAYNTFRAGIRYLEKTSDTLFGKATVDSPRAKPSREDVSARLADESPTLRIAALWDITEHSLATGELLPAVAKCLKDRDSDVQSEAVWALGSFGKLAFEAVPQLVEAAWYGTLETRIAAMKTFAAIGADPAEAVPVLATVLGETDPELVCSAAQGLALYGPAAEQAEPQLLTALESAAAISDENRIENLVAALRVVSLDAKTRIKQHFANRDNEGLRIVLETLRDLAART